MEKYFGLIIANKEKVLYVSEPFLQEICSGAKPCCVHPDDCLDLSRIINPASFTVRLKKPEENYYTKYFFKSFPFSDFFVVCFAPARESAASEPTIGDIFGSFPDTLLLIDSEGKLVDCKIPNGMVLDMPWRKHVGKNVSEILPSNIAETFLQAIGKSIFTGRTIVYEYSLDNDQREKHFEARLSRLSNKHVLVLVRNVGEKKNLLDQLSKQVEKYKTFFTHAPEPYLVLSFPDRKIIHVSAEFTDLFGYSEAEIEERTPEELELWVSDAEKKKYLFMLAKDGVVSNFETLLYNKSRDAFPVLVSSQVVQVNEDKRYLTLIRDVSSQKLSQMKLEESEKRHRKLVEGIGTPIFVHDGDKFLFYNKEFLDFIGLSGQEVEKVNLYDLILPELRAEFAFKVKRAFLGDTSVSRSDMRFVCGDNKIKDTRTNIVGGNYGGKMCAYVSISDLTSLIEARDALVETNEFLNALVASTEDIVLAMDENGKCVFVKMKPDWAGNDRGLFLGKDIEVIFGAGKSLDEFKAMVSNVAETGIPGEFAGCFKILDKEVWLNARCSPFKGPKGNIIGTVSLIKDITASLVERRKILEEQNRLDLIIANISDIVFEVRNGFLSYVSPNCVKVLGKGVGEFLGRSATEFISVWKALRIQRSGRDAEFMVKLVDSDNLERVFEIKLSHIGGSYIGIARDITDSVQKEEAKRAFLGSVAHELRNPLTVISGFSELLEGMVQNNPNALEVVRMIREAALREQRHVDDLVSFGVTKPRYSFKLIDAHGFFIGLQTKLKILFEESLNPMQRKTGASFTIGIDEHLKGRNIKVETGSIEEAFGNLLINAIKYCREERPLEIKLEAKCEGETLLVSFADNGIGIPKSKQNFIFKPFYQVNPIGDLKNGMGMGLSIVKMHVESHGGSVSFSSSEGAGATFFIRLPLLS
ncbi:MAG TPA: PAS domain S-box protein [Caldisericia bacterium]|nr:PAS domain S-box protein [Caldisericia bacterium]